MSDSMRAPTFAWLVDCSSVWRCSLDPLEGAGSIVSVPMLSCEEPN
jgi:hypothetical protein